ncbi:MAG: hypothetical protein KGH49_00680 [Candidatus Micrarchaeota archaeon]|nr:hypothetical protein [Candidatus Micrarchaeota archaeon]
MAKFKLPRESGTLAVLLCYFIVLGVAFYYYNLGQLSWDILLASAIAWLVFEGLDNSKRLVRAFGVGIFLMLFDFAFENAGWLAGLWQTHSIFAIGVVPIQVMGIALFGGAAWALYLPRKFNIWHSVADCIVFATFGALGEWLLIQQGLFTYNLWWNSGLAFLAYFLTWVLLHFVRYKVFKG